MSDVPLPPDLPEPVDTGACGFRDALDLPRFEADERTFLERVTLVANDGEIAKVFYPVFPPDRNAVEVLDWLSKHA